MIPVPLSPVSLRLSDILGFLTGRHRWSEGPDILKSRLARFFGITPDRIRLYASGRMALYSILVAAGVGKGDEVIVPGYTCVVVTNAVKYTGATAIYADIEISTLNMTPGKIRQLVTPRTRAIVVSHNFGIPFRDVTALRREFPDIPVIEDAAHGLGSESEPGIPVGLSGSASFFSMEFSKPITTGMGGVLIVNDPGLQPGPEPVPPPRRTRFRILLSLLVHWATSYPVTFWLRTPFALGLRFLGMSFATDAMEIRGEKPSGYPAGLSGGFAYLGALQADRLGELCIQKKSITEKYHRIFDGIPGLTDVYDPGAVYVRFPLLARDASRVSAICRILTRATGLQTGRWFDDVVHPKGSFRYCYTEGTCPVGEDVSTRIINLPVTVRITNRILAALLARKEEIRKRLSASLAPDLVRGRPGSPRSDPITERQPALKTLVTGYEYFCLKVIRSLVETGTEAVFHYKPYGKRTYPSFLAAAISAHQVYLIGGTYFCGPFSSVPFRFLLAFRKRIIIHWVGSDVLAVPRFPHRDFFHPGVTHLCEAGWIRDELSKKGIHARIVPLLGMKVPHRLPDWPVEFRVLAYVPDGKEELYGFDRIRDLSVKLPTVRFRIMGLKPRQDLGPNVTCLGWTESPEREMADCVCYLRMNKHDGLSVSVLEALSLGRYVAYSMPLEGCFLATDMDGLVRFVSGLAADYARGALAPNLRGSEFVMGEYDAAKTASKLASVLGARAEYQPSV